jgi:uncharacterized protein (TIGR00645 family)
MEKFIETLLYRSRWVLAPIYLGLSLAVFALAVKFFEEVYHMLVHVFTVSEGDLILTILTLIDIAMVGGLLIMVMMSGYENFISQLDVPEDEEKLGWLGKMDSSSLKAKIAASIVAISSIHLLKQFMGITMDMSKYSETNPFPAEALLWFVIIHMTFVVSAFMMGYLDTKTIKH